MSYATIADADLVLTNTTWTALSSDDKQVALDAGTLWIDAKYTCAVTDPVEGNLVRANILLADKYVSGNMFVPVEGNISVKEVKAGTVSSKKEYDIGTQVGVNPYAEIELLLGSVCVITTNGLSLKVVRV